MRAVTLRSMPNDHNRPETTTGIRERRRLETLMLLRNAVISLVSEGENLHSITFAEIGHAAGLDRSSVYHHYKTIPDLFRDALDVHLEARHARMPQLSARDDADEETLLDYIERVTDAQTQLWLEDGRLLLASESLAAVDDAHREWREATLAPWWIELAQVTRRAAAQGEIVPPLDIDSTARVAVLSWYSIAAGLVGHLSGEEPGREQAAAKLRAALVRFTYLGLGGRP